MGKENKAQNVDLSNQGITEIPDYIFKYKNLRKLNLSNNNIKAIPKEIVRLKYLENLDLSNNKITTLYAGNFELPKLQVLNLNNNNLKGIPKQIKHLSSLRRLGLYGNQITALPEELSYLKRLEQLNISKNPLKTFPRIVLDLNSLTRLWLSHTSFTEIPLEELSEKLVHLKAFYCFNPTIDEKALTDDRLHFLQQQRGNAIESLRLLTFKSANETENNPFMKKNADALQHIFICYAHRDKDYKDEVVTTLEALKYSNLKFTFFVDDNIKPGDEWKLEIEEALKKCGIAIVLVSRYFMASKFIQEVELPILLDKALKDGTKILTIITRACPFKDTGLDRYQAVNSPETALLGLPLENQEAVYSKLYHEVKRHISK